MSRVCGRPPGTAFSFDGVAPAIALDVHLEDGRVMDEAIDGGERHGGIGKDLSPFAEGLVGGDEHRSSFVAGADQLEQHAGLGLVLGDVGEVVEDQQVEAVEPVDGGFERQFAAGDLKLLDEVGGAGEEHAPAVLDEGEADGGGQMALSAAGRSEEEQIGALVEPGVAGGDRHDLGLGDHRHGVEVEGVEGLARRQAGLGEMALDAASIALGEFVFGDGGEEAGGGPAFLVGLFGESGPDELDGGKTQFVEQDAELGGIDGAVSSSCRVSHRQAGADQGLVDGERREVDGRRSAVRAGSGAKWARKAAMSGNCPVSRVGRKACRPVRPRSRAHGRARADRP